jgi:hypothetical protein
MFPCYEHKLRWDDYGEIIRPEDWADVKPDDEKVMNKTMTCSFWFYLDIRNLNTNILLPMFNSS